MSKEITPERRRELKLIKAAQEGDFTAVENFLKEGADVNARDFLGETALIRAARKGHAEVVAYLLKKGADVCCHSGKKDAEETALHLAVEGGHTEVVKELLSAKGIEDIIHAKTWKTKHKGCGMEPDKKPFTALELAVRKGHEEIARLLKATVKKSKKISEDPGSPAQKGAERAGRIYD